MALALAFLLFSAGGTLIWSGITDAEGGPIGLLGTILRGEQTPKLKAAYKGATSTAPSGGSKNSGGSEKSPPPSGGGGGGGAGIVAEAARQLGKPYVWGADGPLAFDCSGLAIWCINKGAGMRIPDTTAQGLKGKGKTVSSPQPGDIVFFGMPATHCGIYVGGGRMIHAPNSRSVVKYDSASRSGPIAYRRFV